MMTNTELNQKITELRQIEERAAELKAAVDTIRDQLKAELDSRQVDSITTGAYNIFYKMYEKSGVDTDKLKKSGMYDQFAKTSTVIQFKITDVKVV